MELNKSQKYIYYYIRYSLMLYPVFILLCILIFFIEISWKQDFLIFSLFALIVPITITFFILPGIIYEDGYKYAWHGFGKNQIHYNIFFGITLGFGPWFIFFKKYDPMFREYFKNIKKKS
jgi:hypothetical protein